MNDKYIEDMFPLSPMQKGMIFHSIYAPSDAVYFQQLHCLLEGPLDVDAFTQAWQQAVDRHPILRTSFFWEEIDEPVQVVSRQVKIPIDVQDWTSLSEDEQQSRLNDLLDADRRLGFDLTVAPLMRLTLMRLGPNRTRLVWSHHHLLIDGWSRPMLLEEVFSLYKGLVQGVLPELEQRRPYRDFIAWLQQQPLGGAERFWRERLRGLTSPTPLPTGRGRNSAAAEESFVSAYDAAYGEQRVRLSRELTATLTEAARNQQLTLNAIAQGAWAILLSRYSGEQDVLFGATVAGRPAELPGVERMLGLFINTLPIRIRVDGDEHVGQWLRRLQTEGAEARQYDHTPLVEIASWSEMPRGAELFESLLVFENYPVENTARKQAAKSVLPDIRDIVPFKRTNYPLMLTVAPGTQFGVLFSYERSRFDDETIARLLKQYERLLLAIAADSEQRVGDLQLLTEDEQHQLVTEWNGTRADYSPEICLHELFAEQAARTPTAIAATFKDEQLTYEQLNERANQLAHYLIAQQTGPDVIVGICLEPSLEMLVAILGVLKAGGAYLPLDPAYPRERLAFMIEDAGNPVIVTRQQQLAALPNDARVTCLDRDSQKIALESTQNPATNTTPANGAYVIYTSGSTGKPKGVLVTHDNVTRLLAATGDWYRFNEHDVWTLFHSYAFDFSVWELWGSLLYGGRLVIVPYLVTRSPEAFYELLSREGVTVLNQTPSAFRQLMQAEKTRPDPLPLKLRFVIFGGEALDLKSLKPWFERHGDEQPQLVNMYGITETTVHVTYRPLTIADVDSSASLIGRQIPDLDVYILDQRLQLVPPGVPGELYVGGAGLARNYLNRAGLTAERFLPNPFSNKPGERIYKAGDQVRYFEAGEIEYLGRIDQQVKIRGFRIELGEIESVLAQAPRVAAAAVTIREEAGGGRRLVGYVVPEVGVEPNIGDLRAFIKERLPEYMIPVAWVMLEALPLTVNGKVDRRALPAPEDNGLVAVTDFVAPRSPVEEMLAEIWADVLRVERVGLSDNFFDLGGHSLLATQVVSRMRQVFQIEVSLNDLFDAETFVSLAEKVEAEIKLQRGLRRPPIIRRERSDFLPLSFAQQRIWFLDQLRPGTSTYNVRHNLRLSGRIDVNALRRSLTEMARRHEALRTSFTSIEGTPSQVVNEDYEMQVPVVDLSLLDETERLRAARKLTEAEIRRPFDLLTGPLLRMTLLRLSGDDHVALLTMHHIISDAWSLRLLVREIVALYEAFTRGAASPLKDLPLQYADYALWQRDWLQGEVLEMHLSYWKNQLANIPSILELPTDRPRPRVQTDHGAVEFCEFSPELAQKLKVLSRDEGVTLFMTLLAAFQVLLHRYSGQDQIVVGTPIANRGHAEIEGLIGFFINTLVINTDLSDDLSFRELLQRVRDVCLGAYVHQDVPFEMLVEELQPQRSLSHSPLFQVMFTLQTAPSDSLAIQGLKVGSFGTANRTAKFDLNLSLHDTKSGLVGGLEYNTDLFERETVERMVGHLGALLAGIASDPGQRVSELPLLTDAEQRQLLVEWNDTRQEYPRHRCVHELFEEQVARTPENTALVFEDERLTYRELNQRANQLTHHLRALGVGPEVRVGIMTKRSVEMMVAVLGTLKAGGAYVPLDPVYPQERIKFMLADSGATVLLTHGEVADEVELDSGFAESDLLVVRLDELREELARQREEDPHVHVDADNVGYVIYTSGSTGRPKGIALPHRALTNLIEWHLTKLASGVTTLQFSSLSFDSSFHEAFSAWCSGGEVLVLSESQRLDVAKLAHTLDESKTEKAILPVVVLQQLAEIYNENGAHVLGSLREVITTGEQLQITTPIRKLFKRLRDCTLHNHYGPSETHVVTYHVLGSESDEWPSHPPIGKPIANTKMYLLDKNLHPVPVGVLGEVYIGGVMLARGYVNRPGVTAEKFIPDPYSSVRGARLYKTGDWGRYLTDGSIEFLGRIDHQVKVRGFRIELDEIESVLSKHDRVRECVVLARDDEAWGEKRLIAYVVAEPGSEPGVIEMRGYIQQHLPEYMVPSVFVTLDELPLTRNGKVDRRALPAPDLSRALSEESIAPRTPAEQVVANIFAEVLRVEKVGINDNFFDLGGHSLLATQLISRVVKVFQVDVPLQTLFDTPTVAAVIDALSEQWSGRDVVEEIAQTYLDIEQMPDESVAGMLAN